LRTSGHTPGPGAGKVPFRLFLPRWAWNIVPVRDSFPRPPSGPPGPRIHGRRPVADGIVPSAAAERVCPSTDEANDWSKTCYESLMRRQNDSDHPSERISEMADEPSDVESFLLWADLLIAQYGAN
jgi:hypothetical protein